MRARSTSARPSTGCRGHGWCGKSRSRRIDPLTLRFDQLDKLLVGEIKGDVALNALFADVQVDLSWTRPDVTEVGISHLPWPIHNASHNGDLHPGQMAGPRLDALTRRLQVELRATA